MRTGRCPGRPVGNRDGKGGRLKNARARSRKWRPSFSYMGAAMRSLKLLFVRPLGGMAVLTGQKRITGLGHETAEVSLDRTRNSSQKSAIDNDRIDKNLSVDERIHRVKKKSIPESWGKVE